MTNLNYQVQLLHLLCLATLTPVKEINGKFYYRYQEYDTCDQMLDQQNKDVQLVFDSMNAENFSENLQKEILDCVDSIRHAVFGQQFNEI
jgi:hypothetical protein